MAEKIAGIQPLQECLLKTLGENLIGIYLHGSLAFGCFHPLKSDIDVLAVVERPLTQPEKEKVIHSLLSIWHFAPEKGYEMSIVLEKVCRRFAYPTPYELHFSKAWIGRFREDSKSVCNDFPKTDPDLAAHFAVVKARGITLFGPPAPELFAEIPEEAYLDSIYSDIADCRETVMEEPVYTILNLCRVLSYLQDGKLRSKVEGGQWGVTFFSGSACQMVEKALHLYQTGTTACFDADSCDRFCTMALKRIQAELKKRCR